jgi:Fe-S cluster assembly protein SufD
MRARAEEMEMTVAVAQDQYLARFESFLAGRAGVEPSWLTTIRRAAHARFQALGFPTTRDEEWRFTPVAPIADTVFLPADTAAAVSRAQLLPYLVRPLSCTQLVFVNGRFSPGLSTVQGAPKGVVAASLASVLQNDPGLVDPYFTRCATFDGQSFTALNTAFAADGAVLYIPANAVLPAPVQILYYSTNTASAPVVVHPRTIIVAGDNSEGRIIETYAGPDGERYFTNAVTEIVGGENAQLQHYRVQRESLASYHVSSTHIYLERSAVFAQQSFTFGGALVRNDVSAKLDAEGIECTINGLYLASGERLVDNHTTIDHAKPHCNSHEIYKGMLDGRARGVFNGKIFVRQDAQKTDAKQTNQVLLLSDDATINTKPQLEIFADDVKCTHGATVGQIDAEALFYLRARGIGEDEARAMLVHAFASDIIDRVTIEPLRQSLESMLLAYVPN